MTLAKPSRYDTTASQLPKAPILSRLIGYSALVLCLCFFSSLSLASSTGAGALEHLDLTQHWAGYTALALFISAYIVVILEEKIHMRKSKPVMLSAGTIWGIIAWIYHQHGFEHSVEQAIRHNFLEYVELFFFLLVAMTYINSMIERGVFKALRNKLVAMGLSYRQLFWVTGLLAFFISPIADNLTTALIMCAVILAVGEDKPGFVSLACINIVVASNAGGAFSPFGDITTLMVWQKGIMPFFSFFSLFLPSLISFLVPAFIMQFWITTDMPENRYDGRESPLQYGGIQIIILFLITIITAISFHSILHIPPVFGMMTGLAFLKFYGFYLRMKKHVPLDNVMAPPGSANHGRFDVFDKVAKSEWDTLFFFYGVIMSVGGLAYIGYLSLASEFIYGSLGHTTANVLVGIISAIVDNIPVMFAVLTMHPEMSNFQWLLVTLTAGIGGSLLSVGSAAGVALMGQAKGKYTFFGHLKWLPAIALGYGAAIVCHFIING